MEKEAIIQDGCKSNMPTSKFTLNNCKTEAISRGKVYCSTSLDLGIVAKLQGLDTEHDSEGGKGKSGREGERGERREWFAGGASAGLGLLDGVGWWSGGQRRGVGGERLRCGGFVRNWN
ncbi:hypothetical protein KY285_036662 [Solanum tuberosum]|nr:hypothetical protein KY284_036704 [Solanum tuberosum]KAH0640076.1 hypothetical protein KY285_036662 [Solanum tuberosum]